MNGRQTYSRQNGLTLVEIMISLALSLILMTGAILLFQSNKQTFQLQQAMSEVQEFGRYAVDMIARDVRGSSFYGCASRERPIITNTLNNKSNDLWNFEQGIVGYDYSGSAGTAYAVASNPGSSSWSPNVDATIYATATGGGRKLVPGSDILVVRAVQDYGFPVQTPGASNVSADIKTIAAARNYIDVNDVVMASDCQNAAIFQVTNCNCAGGSGQLNLVHNTGTVSDGPGNSTKFLGPLSENANLLILRSNVYFVAEVTRASTGEKVRALFKIDEKNNAHELVEGVESLQLMYGIDATPSDPENNDVGSYVTAGAVTNWENVVAVKAALVMRSINPEVEVRDKTNVSKSVPTDYILLSDSNGDGVADKETLASLNFDLDGDGTVDDKLPLRQVFSMTATVRNKML